LRDILLQCAGVLAIVAAAIHGVLTETKVTFTKSMPSQQIAVWFALVQNLSSGFALGSIQYPVQGSHRNRVDLVAIPAPLIGSTPSFLSMHLFESIKSVMLSVLDLDPMLGPSALIRPVAMLRHQALEFSETDPGRSPLAQTG